MTDYISLPKELKIIIFMLVSSLFFSETLCILFNNTYILKWLVQMIGMSIFVKKMFKWNTQYFHKLALICHYFIQVAKVLHFTQLFFLAFLYSNLMLSIFLQTFKDFTNNLFGFYQKY